MSKPILEIKNVNASFGVFKLKSISMKVFHGDFMTVMGPCGAGKTKILELITGASYPESGQIFFMGKDITLTPPYKRKIGIMYQKSHLFPHLSVKKNITFGLKYTSFSDAEINRKLSEIVSLLNLSDIIDRTSIKGLSGGESQKISLARTLILEPELILLDEPFSSLDMGSRREFTDLFQQLNKKQGKTFIYVTHLSSEIEKLSKRTCIISNGEIIQSGCIDSIRNNPCSSEVEKLFAASDYQEKIAKIEIRESSKK